MSLTSGLKGKVSKDAYIAALEAEINLFKSIEKLRDSCHPSVFAIIASTNYASFAMTINAIIIGDKLKDKK